MHTQTHSRRRTRSLPGVEPLEARSLLASSGSLDPSFGSGQGSVTLPISINAVLTPLTGQAEVVQLDGKIVVAGVGTSAAYGTTTFLIARFNADGSADTTFGTGGQVVVPFDNLAAASAVAIQPDGKIVVGGRLEVTVPPPNTPAQFDFAATRLNANGSVDTSFGVGGTTSFALGGPISSSNTNGDGVDVKSILVQADGKILLAGDAVNAAGTGTDFAAARLTPSGTLDPSWGGTGIVLVPVKVNNYEEATAGGAALTSGGKLVLAGSAFQPTTFLPTGIAPPIYEAMVLRFNTDGSLDPTFGDASTPGIADPYPTTQYRINAMALQPDGKIVLAQGPTASNYNPSAIRLDADGSADTTFGSDGVASYPASGTFINAPAGSNVAIEPDGKVVLLISPDSNSIRTGYTLIRFTSSGVLDTTFGLPATPGESGLLFAGITSTAALTTQPDGKILVASFTKTSSTSGTVTTTQEALILGRVLSDPVTTTPALLQPPADLDGSGRTNLSVYLPAIGAFFYVPTDGGAYVTVPFGIPGAGQTIPAAADYDGVGHAEIAAYIPRLGDYAIRDPLTGQDRLFQFGPAGAGQSIPTPADFEGTGEDDVAIYMPTYGAFAILPSNGSPGRIVPFGTPGPGLSIPAPADYLGTGQADIAVYLATQGAFAIRPPGGGNDIITPFGAPGLSIPVPGDYDGSGHVELAVYIPSQGAFYYRPFNGGPDVKVSIGTPGTGQLPVPGDYTGVGHLEVAIYDRANGFFEYRPSGGGADVITYLGTPGYTQAIIPVAAPAGSLPEFDGSSSGGGNAIHVLSMPAAGPSTTGLSVAVAASRTSAVPAGPASFASSKVALRPVAQAKADPPDLLA